MNHPVAGREIKIVLDTPVSREAIRRALKNKLRPHKNDYWGIPTKDAAEFIACMEDVLDVYELPYNSKDQLFAWTKSLTSYWTMQENQCPCVRATIRK